MIQSQSWKIHHTWKVSISLNHKFLFLVIQKIFQAIMIQTILNYQLFFNKLEHQKISSLYLKTKIKKKSQLFFLSSKFKASKSKQIQNRCSSNTKKWIFHQLWKNYRKWNYYFSIQIDSNKQEITFYHHHQHQNHQFLIRRNLTQFQNHLKNHSTNHFSQSM